MAPLQRGDGNATPMAIGKLAVGQGNATLEDDKGRLRGRRLRHAHLGVQLSAPLGLFGQADAGDNVIAYAASLSADGASFTALSNTLAPPVIGADDTRSRLFSAAQFDDKTWLLWADRAGMPGIVLQEISIDGNGLASVASFTNALSTAFDAVISIGGNTYGVTAAGAGYQFSISGNAWTVTSVGSILSGAGSVGATARTADGSVYLVSNRRPQFNRDIRVDRVSFSGGAFSTTELTLSGDTTTTDQIEAALGLGPDVYIFARDDRTVWHGVITSDAMALTELSDQTPASAYYAALTA